MDALQFDPGLVGCAVEAVVLDALADEGDDTLGAVLVFVGQVDFVTEDDEPFAQLDGSFSKGIKIVFRLI